MPPAPLRLGAARRFAALVVVLSFVSGGVVCAPASQESAAPAIALPGAEPFADELRTRLLAALAAKGDGYEPRTRHFRADGSPLYTNRLIFEDSPYLLQHAHNPVSWYPWGAEAFAKAAREDKPIFLSIGYSTCHWCHVMERESFEDEEIARVLNQRFVAIKVDRERRPDVDDVYMTAVQLLTGSGGWPMTSFLTPAGKPFYGGTYLPPEHFTQLLGRVDELWHGEREKLLATAERLSQAVAEVTASRGKAEEIGRQVFDEAVAALLERHDAELGGFGAAPKFPHEPELLFLAERALRSGGEKALAAVEKSLDAMARGGVYDQVGGGFHRYSTDARWQVPHFEKMLYNQAHLARAYLASYRLTGDAFHARVARQTLDYVLREMTAPGGGFYSATDADSDGEEGRFFVWTPAELAAALAADDAKLAADLFGVTEGGNFEGRNILHLPLALETYAARHGMELGALLTRVDRIRETLWQAREKRVHPLRDDKVLTAWNGMMITALAAGSAVLGDERYLAAARRAAELLWRQSRRGDDGLWRVRLQGSSSVPALQEDYAYFAEALLALYDRTAEPAWLERARQVTDAMLERFWDDADGGFYMGAEEDGPHLIARPKSPADGAVPSGNSVAVRVLARLAGRTGETSYADRAGATLTAFAGFLGKSPASFPYMLIGADDLLHGEVGPLRYAAGGTVRAAARIDRNGDGYSLAVALRLRDGWHVNAHEPLQQELVPTVLSLGADRGGWRLGEVAYPAPERVKLGFQEAPLAVYRGEVELAGRLLAPRPIDALAVVPVQLRVQACNHELCLRPETIVLQTPLGSRTETQERASRRP